jgi:hypothetical protein
MSAIGSSHTFTATTQQPKLNVVTRLAIEGKAKEGQDGIAIKMYLKVCSSQSNLREWLKTMSSFQYLWTLFLPV